MQHEKPSAVNDPTSHRDKSSINDDQRFLVYVIGGELYGTSLTTIKEVLKKSEIKDVPYMKSYFKGIINLRGQIVSVIDLREKFEIPFDKNGNDLMLVVECDGHSMAVIVDDVHSVTVIPDEDIETNPGLSSKIEIEFFHGIAKVKNKLVNLIYLEKVLTTEDYSTIKRFKEAI